MITSVKKQGYDIIVVGGGIAGCCAALAAARENKSVLLVEKHINLGGLATIGLISWFEPLCDGEGRKMMGGMAEEMIRLAVGCGYDNLPEIWGGTSGNAQSSDRYSTHFSPTFFSLALDDILRKNGVTILYDALATYPEVDNNVIVGITVENIDGRLLYPCKAVIDCTGDAAVASRAGVPTRTYDNTQTYVVHDTNRRHAAEFVDSGNMIKLRHWQWFKPGEETIGEVTSAIENDYLRRSKQMTLAYYVGTDKNEREILTLPELPQIRLLRAIIGAETFLGRVEDIDKHVANSIGSTGDFAHCDYRFDVPYGCLYNTDFPNLLCAGRIVSADGNGAHVLRVVPCCCLTGQAAGIAAAVAIEQNKTVADVYDLVKPRLVSSGVAFEIK